jgi:hypothetical protein
VRFSQLVLENFPGGGQRERLTAKLDRAGTFVTRDASPTVGDEIVARAAGPGLQTDDSVYSLAPFLIGHPDNCAFRHIGMFKKRVLVAIHVGLTA